MHQYKYDLNVTRTALYIKKGLKKHLFNIKKTRTHCRNLFQHQESFQVMALVAIVAAVLALVLLMIVLLTCCQTGNEKWHKPHSSRISTEPVTEVKLAVASEPEEAPELHTHLSSPPPPPLPSLPPSSITMDDHRGWRVLLLLAMPVPETSPVERSPELYAHPSFVRIFCRY